MKHPKFLPFFVILLAVMLSACTNSQVVKPSMATPTADMVDKAVKTAMEQATATPEKAMEVTATLEDRMDKPTTEAMMKAPAWFSATLTNVNTGEDFTIDDFKGQVILVEMMAQWCPTCKKQQMEVKALLDELGMPKDLVTIVLDIDPNESAESLKTYAAKNGFNWIYVIAPPEVMREIGQLYGNQFLNPPSAPILVIDRQGEVHALPFGLKNASTLLDAINPYLNAGKQ